MMRGTLPLNVSRPSNLATPPQPHNPQSHIPSIRLISATPSATGMSSEGNSTIINRSIDSSWASVPSPLAPRADPTPKKRLVPKKSKLSMLGVGSSGKDKSDKANKDFSDVVRRVGAAGGTTSTRGGFEIYVDPTDDPEIGEIVMVKKKKSRVGLDGMRWGALGEVTNVPQVTQMQPKDLKEAPGLLKVKQEEGSGRWWSIGRGRKDSKEKEKEKIKEVKEQKRDKSKTRAKCLAFSSSAFTHMN